MRLPRSVVPLATLAVVLGVPSVAGAGGLATSDRLLVSPTQRVDGLDAGEAMGLNWVRGYTLPAAENPMLGNSAPCVRLGSHGKILVGVGYQPVRCTVDSNTTVLVWGLSNTCDTVDPLSPWYAVGERAQRACAVATIEPYVQEIRFTIDGGPAIDLHHVASRSSRPSTESDSGPTTRLGCHPGRRRSPHLGGWPGSASFRLVGTRCAARTSSATAPSPT